MCMFLLEGISPLCAGFLIVIGTVVPVLKRPSGIVMHPWGQVFHAAAAARRAVPLKPAV